MKTISKLYGITFEGMGTGAPYGFFFDVDTPPAPPAPPALPPKEPAAPALPPKEPVIDPNAPPPPVSYDFDADPSGFNTIALPEGQMFGGKYKNVGELQKGLEHANGLVGKKTDELAAELGFVVPESYDFGEHGKDWDEETTAGINAKFKEIGLTAKQAAATTPMLLEISQELANAVGRQELMEAWNVTGADFTAKESEVATWAGANLPDSLYQTLAGMGAEGMLVAESMQVASRERPLYGGNAPQIDAADLEAQITTITTKMSGLLKDGKEASTEYKGLEKQRWALYNKKNPE